MQLRGVEIDTPSPRVRDAHRLEPGRIRELVEIDENGGGEWANPAIKLGLTKCLAPLLRHIPVLDADPRFRRIRSPEAPRAESGKTGGERGIVMSHDVVLLERLPQLVLSIRARVRRADVGSTFDAGVRRIREHLVRVRREPAGPPCARFRSVGAGGEVDVDVGIPVSRGTEGGDGIRVRELPSGSVAVIQHYGALSRLGEAYDAAERWISSQGAESLGAPWEVYWSEPSEDSDPLRWRTELLWPVRLRFPARV